MSLFHSPRPSYLLNFITVLLTSLLISCGGSSDKTPIQSGSGAIWDSTSQRLVIEVSDPLNQDFTKRAIRYDLARDSLSDATIARLIRINSTQASLSCRNDVASYQVSITNGSGQTTSYLANTNACSDNSQQYLKESDIKAIIALIAANS